MAEPEAEPHTRSAKPRTRSPGKLIGLLKPYRHLIGLLLVLAALSNGLNLLLPRLIQQGIDSYLHQHPVVLASDYLLNLSWPFLAVSLLIFVCAYLQSLVQTWAAERVGRDLRQQLANQMSEQSFPKIQELTPAKLLTFLTSDIEAIKLFVSMAIPSIASSLILIFGASTLLLLTHWLLALAVLLTLPMIGTLFFRVFSRVRVLFSKSQEAIDRLNRVINESILGSALIRVLNTQHLENEKFLAANAAARDNGLLILRQFAGLIPWVTFIAGLGTLILLVLGGRFVIEGHLSLGQFTAFNAYLGLLIFPVLILGFMSNLIARASASYGRISALLHTVVPPHAGSDASLLRGEIVAEGLSISLGQKPVLCDVSFRVAAGSRTAIIGPTAAGKSTLLYLLAGLLPPDEGRIRIDARPLESYSKEALHRQVGFVFQDSALFNMSLRENIAFNQEVSAAELEKALATSELSAFVSGLPQGIETIVSERGLSLSGGQKQRIILARALALNPRILLLDDFTARVDTLTERRILANIAANYPDLTLISVTQKIAAVEPYEQILLLMEGELLASGNHAELMSSSPEYVQIYQSQRSTQVYEQTQEQEPVHELRPE
ncbi:MAG TPA: ABC transporter ATP-binding protein [Candidatus Obscuribacterales bacterium]